MCIKNGYAAVVEVQSSCKAFVTFTVNGIFHINDHNTGLEGVCGSTISCCAKMIVASTVKKEVILLKLDPGSRLWTQVFVQ